MAGARGKSRGCGTCRARKIACGQERPSCAQCIKSRRQCTGYHRDKVFVHVQPGTKPACPTSKKECSPTSPGPEQSTGYEMVMNCHRRQQLLDSFLYQCLSHQQLRPKVHNKPWILLLPDIPMKSKTFEFSMLALASASLGRKFHDRSLTHQSLVMYTRGLRELQMALWSVRSMRDDQTLAACLVLSLYELMECPDNGFNAYVNHCRGFLAIIKARGLDAHVSGMGHDLLLGVRFPGIMDALARRIPNYLSEPDWCCEPWALRPKRMPDRIADALAAIPSILQRYDHLASLPQRENIGIAKDLRLEALAVDQDLDGIYEDFRRETSGPLFWPVLSSAFQNNAPDGALFPVNYHFPDLRTAGIMMLYWGAKALVWSVISNLCDILEVDDARATHLPAVVELGDDNTFSPDDKSPTSGTSIPSDHRQIYITMARNVCQSLEFCFQDQESLIGIFATSMPITVAIWAMRNRNHHEDGEFAWLMRVQEKMRQSLRLWQYI